MLGLQRLLNLILMGNFHGHVYSLGLVGPGITLMEGPATHLNEIDLVFLSKKSYP